MSDISGALAGEARELRDIREREALDDNNSYPEVWAVGPADVAVLLRILRTFAQDVITAFEMEAPQGNAVIERAKSIEKALTD